MYPHTACFELDRLCTIGWRFRGGVYWTHPLKCAPWFQGGNNSRCGEVLRKHDSFFKHFSQLVKLLHHHQSHIIASRNLPKFLSGVYTTFWKSLWNLGEEKIRGKSHMTSYEKGCADEVNVSLLNHSLAHPVLICLLCKYICLYLSHLWVNSPHSL